MCLPKILFPVFMFAYIFSLPLIFTWPLTFLIYSPPLKNFHIFLATKFISLALSVYSTWVWKKNEFLKQLGQIQDFLQKEADSSKNIVFLKNGVPKFPKIIERKQHKNYIEFTLILIQNQKLE